MNNAVVKGQFRQMQVGKNIFRKTGIFENVQKTVILQPQFQWIQFAFAFIQYIQTFIPYI